MELKIAGNTIDKYNDVTVNLKYDSIASTFGFKVYFDPDNSVHKTLFKPGMYHRCEIRHGDVLLLTGTALIGSFEDSEVQSLVNISGYSLTGILEDCPVVTTPLENNGLTFKEIAEKITAHYGISVIVDKEVATICNTVIAKSLPNQDQSVRSYLDDISKQLNIVLSHTPEGNLLLTRVKVGKMLTTVKTYVRIKPTARSSAIEGAPEFGAKEETTKVAVSRAILFDFDKSVKQNPKWLNMKLKFDGQKMHSDILVVGQAGENTNNAPQSDREINPYVPAQIAKAEVIINKVIPFTTEIQGSPSSLNILDTTPKRGIRPRTEIQTKGDDNTAPLMARSILSDELKNITLSIEVEGWTLNDNLITPNQMITVINPSIFLYFKTQFFIQDVSFSGNEAKETAIITCVVPECFNKDIVKNIFDATTI